MSRIVYLNGRFVGEDQACISPLDRGFLLGDGVYEVIPAYHGQLFRLEPHLQRLDHSLQRIAMRNPLSNEAWRTTLQQLVDHNGGGDLSVYLQVTRGVAARDHSFPDDVSATVFAMATPIAPFPADLKENGVAAITLEDIRWQYCGIKAITLLPNVLMRQQAKEAGASEAILLRQGHVTEGAASNVFIVSQRVLFTPARNDELLPGITRDLVLELATELGIETRETTVSESQLRAADEIWLTSSTREILPVTRLDHQALGDGRPGPLWALLHARYQQYKRDLAHAPH